MSTLRTDTLQTTDSLLTFQVADLVDAGFVNSYKSDLANNTDVDKGSNLVGYRGRGVDDKFQERIDVTDHFVIGDPNWSNAIDRCIALAEAAASSNTAPNFVVPKIWFPRAGTADGSYNIERPIFSSLPMQFDGDGARIYPTVGFVGKTLNLQLGGAEVNSSMIILLHGNKLNTAGQLRWRAKIGEGLILDCLDIVSNGVYIERMPYSNINCVIRGCVHDGVQVGPFCWGINFDNIVIENFTDFGLHFLKDSACNGMSIKNPKIWGQFKTSMGGLLFDQDAEANGASISGGFIEKLDYGVLIAAGNGPMIIDGVDFEQCTFACVRAAAVVFTGQKIGPISVTSCFLHTTGATKIYADHATINVSGCRMFPGTADFETDATRRGIINAKDNRYMNADTVGLGANITMAFEQNDGVSKTYRNYLPHKVSSFLPVYDLRNYQLGDAPQLQSSGHAFYSNYQGGGTGQYVSRSDWWISEYQHVTAPGVLNKTIGVRLANDAGQNSFQPMTTGITSCGAAGASWSGGSTVVAFTVTSDFNHKTGIRDITEAEHAVAVKCKGLLKAFKLKLEVEKEGDDAGTHFGVIAQDVCEAFESEGLRWQDYKIVEYNEWDATEDEYDSEGTLTYIGREAGNVYSVRYEQLLAFILSTL